VRHSLQQLIELEVAAVLGADRHKSSEDQFGCRNGYRPRLLTTQVGDIELRSRNSARAGFYPRSWRLGGGSIRLSTQW
jgi:transposase-like protein